MPPHDTRDWAVSYYPFKYNDDIPCGIGAIVQDITVSKQAEQQVEEHQKQLEKFSRLSAIGGMASGIAHEMNQPLTSIVHYAGGCVERLRAESVSDEITNAMQAVIKEAERAGDIIHRIKNFLKSGEMDKHTIDINEVITEVLNLLKLKISSTKIKVQMKLAAQPLLVEIDKIQIQQVLLNIANNSIEAMRELSNADHGKLTIETSLRDNDKMAISISDTGPGIQPENIDNVFKPFFTTKTEGMGIGLAFSHSIVQAHGGKMMIEDNSVHGVKLSVILPLA